MRYLKTLQLWDSGIQEAIKSGQLKLCVGQWVICGTGHKSRYVGHTKHTINLVHWQGSGKATQALFKRRLAAQKEIDKRERQIKAKRAMSAKYNVMEYKGL